VNRSAPASTGIDPGEVIDFWFAAGPEKWFGKAPDFDAEIAARFGEAAERAAAGAFDHWTQTRDGTLALILILDQFRRNILRGTPGAFAADAKALAIARAAVARGLDRELPREQRKWIYLPFEHAEDLEVQQQSVALFEANAIAEDLEWALDHLDIIACFGRFPHRNAILGRTSTPDEEEFLANGGFAG
jgi:uncharacterized protein (DUF924 family)